MVITSRFKPRPEEYKEESKCSMIPCVKTSQVAYDIQSNAWKPLFNATSSRVEGSSGTRAETFQARGTEYTSL